MTDRESAMLEELRHMVERIETFAEWAARDRISGHPSQVGSFIIESVREHKVLESARRIVSVADTLAFLDSNRAGGSK